MKKIKDLQDVIELLAEAESVEEVAKSLGTSSKSLRRKFANADLPSPATYLPYTKKDLTKNQKRRIVQLYSDIGGGKTANEIAAELNEPVDKVKEYIKTIKMNHSDLPLTPSESKKLPEAEKVKQTLEVQQYKLRAKLEATEIDNQKKDALKWQNWKAVVGDKLFSLLTTTVKNYKVPKFDLNLKREYAAVLSIQDFHFGRWADSIEVKDATDIAKQKEDLFKCIFDLLEKVSCFGLPEALYLTIGGDFINSDNHKLTTTMGTPQDSLPSHTFLQYYGGMLLVEMIDCLRQLFPKIILVPSEGNHDRDTSVSLFMFVSAWFKNCEQIESIFSNEDSWKNPNLRPRQYRKYGSTLIAFSHGDSGPKPEAMPLLIANEARELWGQCKYTIYIAGHRHSRISQDIYGTQFSQVASIAGDDRYHAQKGYCSQRGLNMILIDKHTGYMCEIFSPVV